MTFVLSRQSAGGSYRLGVRPGACQYDYRWHPTVPECREREVARTEGRELLAELGTKRGAHAF